MPQQQRAGISAVRPTVRSRLADLVAWAAQPIAVDERHARRIADRATSLADWLPGVGATMGAQEGIQQAQRGQRTGRLSDVLVGGGAAVLSMLPGGGKVGKVLGQGAAKIGKVANETGDGFTDAVSSMSSLLRDPRPTHALYQKGDVLALDGSIGEVVGETSAGLVLALPQGRVIVQRNDPRLKVADPKHW